MFTSSLLSPLNPHHASEMVNSRQDPFQLFLLSHETHCISGFN
jgi:hypothetical protein